MYLSPQVDAVRQSPATMRVLHLCIALVIVNLVFSRPPTCTRKPPNNTDCSTFYGSCDYLYNSTSAPYGLISQLPNTLANTRTCYRSCFHDGTCKSFPTGIHQQRLRAAVQSPYGNMYNILSPGYDVEESSNTQYRKSTICRYSVQCEPGQILSYTIKEFDLQEKVYCSNEEVCVDWVDILFYDSNDGPLCGRKEKSDKVFMVGSDRMDFKFVSNRFAEAKGFFFVVQCADSNLGQQNASVQLRPPSNQYCSRPCCSKPPIVVLKKPSYICRFSYFKMIVRRRWRLVLKNYELLIINEQKRVLRRIRVYRLVVRDSPRGDYSRMHYHYYPGYYSHVFLGYGFLTVYRGRAHYLQTRVEPMFIPTRQEARIILRLQRALNNYLELDTFDVKDSLDDQEAKQTPSLMQQRQLRPPYLRPLPTWLISNKEYTNLLALRYGNACNPVLRATACNYQAHVLGKDCKTGLSVDADSAQLY